jgi:hypothetical protein
MSEAYASIKKFNMDLGVQRFESRLSVSGVVAGGGGAVSRTININISSVNLASGSDVDIRVLAEKLARYTAQEERRQGLS